MSKSRYGAIQYYASLFAQDHLGCLHATLSQLWWQIGLELLNQVAKKARQFFEAQHSTPRGSHLKASLATRQESGVHSPEWNFRSKAALDRDREDVIDPALHRQLVLYCLSSKESKPFALYLIASRCGARPQQIREVTASTSIAPARPGSSNRIRPWRRRRSLWWSIYILAFRL